MKKAKGVDIKMLNHRIASCQYKENRFMQSKENRCVQYVSEGRTKKTNES
jgi:hypothetical protein